MSISEMLTAIGDDKIVFQNLDNDLIRISTRGGGTTQLTFGTQAQTTLNGTEKLGFVVWLDREDVEKATGIKV